MTTHMTEIFGCIIRGGVITGILALISVIFTAAYVFIPVISSPEDNYLERKGVLENVTVIKQWQQNSSEFSDVKLNASSGLKVNALIRRPVLSKSESIPIVILLGGSGTGRNACGMIIRTPQVLCASIDYPYKGDRSIKGVEFLLNVRDLQHTVRDTPPAILLLLDYLVKLPGVDRERIELVGVSLGAYFISIPAVLDQRVSRLWIVQGAAQASKVIGYNFIKDVESEERRNFVANMLLYSLGGQHIDPAKWVGRFSPRPVIIVNSERDESLPPESVRALHLAASAPREIIWVKGKHVTPTRQDVIQQLSQVVLKRIERESNKL